jgi:hypothetical protein
MEIVSIPTGYESSVERTTWADAARPVRTSATRLAAVPLSAAECRAAIPRRMSGRDPLRERLLAMILQNETLRRTERR